MDAILVGYFPKRTLVRPPWVHADQVEEIASVSGCISAGPPGWIDCRRHNDYWFFNSMEEACTVLGDDRVYFDMYAYKLYPIVAHQGVVHPIQVNLPPAVPIDGDFHLLGYDAVSRSLGSSFECSPLSCNDAARDHAVNRYCLFESYTTALAGAVEFSAGRYEPGPYYVFEVYRRDRKLSRL
ncbi:hypothetical protein GC175_31465 [bacterium]|nr:hypothetical protein [bacterium]